MKRTAKGHNTRVLLAGEPATRSAPALSFGSILAREGLHPTFSKAAETTSQRRWMKLIRNTDVIVAVIYGRPTAYFARQLQLARLLGVPVVRIWVGTDVLAATRDADARSAASHFDRAVDLNIAVAEHLVDELKAASIEAEFIPSVTERRIDDLTDIPSAGRAVLVYLPGSRKQFYREKALREVIGANADLQFIVVGDDTHSLAEFGNVESLGWMDNLDDIWMRTGALVRLTKHDGLPRMVLDALSRGKYVIYSWPLAGCWRASDAAEVNRALQKFRASSGYNVEGVNAFANLADAGARLAAAIGQARLSTSRGRAFREYWAAHRRSRRSATRPAANP